MKQNFPNFKGKWFPRAFLHPNHQSSIKRLNEEVESRHEESQEIYLLGSLSQEATRRCAPPKWGGSTKKDSGVRSRWGSDKGKRQRETLECQLQSASRAVSWGGRTTEVSRRAAPRTKWNWWIIWCVWHMENGSQRNIINLLRSLGRIRDNDLENTWKS